MDGPRLQGYPLDRDLSRELRARDLARRAEREARRRSRGGRWWSAFLR